MTRDKSPRGDAGGASQYATDANLARRIAIHGFGVSAVSWPEWYFGHVALRPGSRILDIGCGNGYLWWGREALIDPSCTVELADASPGMIEAARERLVQAGPNWRFTVASVEELPYRESSFDIVMANHMLYHVRDLDKAVAELARVLEPQGCLLASTNGRGHMKQLRLWMLASGLPEAEGLTAHSDRFGLENGEPILRRSFARVRLALYHDHLSVPDTGPVMAYVESMLQGDRPGTRDRLRHLEELLRDELRREGRIRIDKETGLFEATGPMPPLGSRG